MHTKKYPYLKETLLSVFETVFDLLFPPRCIECNKQGTVLCNTCTNTIEFTPSLTCQHCFRTIEPPYLGQTICKDCIRKHSFCQIFSWSKNTKLLQKAIHSYKYDFCENLAKPLSNILLLLFNRLVKKNGYTLEQMQNIVHLVPVPIHQERKKWRGFNQSELLGKYMSEKTGFPVSLILQRGKNTHTQMQLTRSERWNNMKDSFEWNDVYRQKQFENKLIVLIDDVATTGATLQNCYYTLREHNITNVLGIVLAHGD